ncbi:phosphotransferase [Nonomuraea sp. NPDC005983]|uniref:phosphotransferase n=1 Tax=Nonomuraea sp. NPDC005983 TaxID=3155595 RepID=UPI0033BB8B5D
MPLSGYSSASAWKLRTEAGLWVVKAQYAIKRWEVEAMRHSGDLERAALAAGIAVPRPVEGGEGAAGFWAPAPGGTEYLRVSAWADGPRAELPAGRELAAWLGGTVAALAAVAPPVDVRQGRGYPLHPLAQWEEWLSTESVGRREKARLLSAAADGTPLVQEALAASRSPFVLSHRDLNHRNILLTPHGPTLIDFDQAGPEVPWWELVHFAFLLACASLGDDEPDPVLLGAAVSAFAERGGNVGELDLSAFAGLLRGMLEWPAANLMVLAGDAPAARRGEALRQVAEAARVLPVIMGSVERWVAVLRAL